MKIALPDLASPGTGFARPVSGDLGILRRDPNQVLDFGIRGLAAGWWKDDVGTRCGRPITIHERLYEFQGTKIDGKIFLLLPKNLYTIFI